MMYDLPNFTTPADLMVYASTVTNGWFWPLVLMAIWVVTFVTLVGFSSMERGFAASSFMTGILATFIFTLGGMDALYAVLFVALAIGSFVLLLFSKE